jgi:hypothetical protein
MFGNLFRNRVSPRVAALLVAAAVSGVSPAATAEDRFDPDRLPNNFPFFNSVGTAATFSPAGFVDLRNEFHIPQGTNGRTCETCHLPHAGWSIRPVDVELRFLLSAGKDALFNPLDANSPTADVSSAKARYAAYSMLRKGLFRRGGDVPQDAEFEIVSVDDPLKAGGSTTRFTFFRRPLATANFHIAKNIGWHDQNADMTGDAHAGLVSQARGAIVAALQGPVPTAETLETIASYQEGLRFAQQSLYGVGSLSSCGARGGPENLSNQPPQLGLFDLFDAWIGLPPGSCTTRSADRKRAQIARGQELFNSMNPGGRRCSGCHSAANNGSSMSGALFDIGTSRPKFRKPGMPLYTLRNKVTNDLHVTTDPGRALRTGKWQDLDHFKSPSLRGLASRAPYFHNGIAATLKDVVVHYEKELNFQYTDREREDLVAFLEAL